MLTKKQIDALREVRKLYRDEEAQSRGELLALLEDIEVLELQIEQKKRKVEGVSRTIAEFEKEGTACDAEIDAALKEKAEQG